MKTTQAAIAAVLALTIPAAAQNGSLLLIPGWTQAIGVSADGRYVVGSASGTAVRWDLQTSAQTALGPGFATAVSSDGSIIAGYSGQSVFRWTQPTGSTPIGSTTNGLTPGLSADGSTIVATDNTNHPYRWSLATGRRDLDLPSGSISAAAYASSADGSVIVGGASMQSGGVPIIWHGTSYTITSPLPPNADADLVSVNADGTVAFGSRNLPTRDMFRWTAQTGNVDLGFTGTLSTPWTTTAAGDIAVASTFDFQGAVWRQGAPNRTLTDVLQNDFHIDLSGLTLFFPHGLSADGRVLVGTGNHTGMSDRFGFVITLPWSIPSPGSSLPLAALLLCGRRRTQTR